MANSMESATSGMQQSLFANASPEDKTLAEYITEIYRRTYGAYLQSARKGAGTEQDVEEFLRAEYEKYPYRSGMTVEKSQQPEDVDKFLVNKLRLAVAMIPVSEIEAIVEEQNAMGVEIEEDIMICEQPAVSDYDILANTLDKARLSKKDAGQKCTGDSCPISYNPRSRAAVGGRASAPQATKAAKPTKAVRPPIM